MYKYQNIGINIYVHICISFTTEEFTVRFKPKTTG